MPRREGSATAQHSAPVAIKNAIATAIPLGAERAEEPAGWFAPRRQRASAGRLDPQLVADVQDHSPAVARRDVGPISLAVECRHGFNGSCDAAKAHTAADYWLHDNSIPRTPEVPPSESAGLGVDDDDLFVFMAIDALIELDDHPHLMNDCPGLQQNEIGCVEGNAYQGSLIARLRSQTKFPPEGCALIASDAEEERLGVAGLGVGTCHRLFGVTSVAAVLCAEGRLSR